MKKVLPFSVKLAAPMFSKRASADYDALSKGLRALVKRFGYQGVLRELVDLAGSQFSLAAQRREDFELYREASDLLGHAQKTLQTIVRLHNDLADKVDDGGGT